MKIIEIIYNLSSGGAERFAVDLSNQLSEANDVSLFTLKDDCDIRNVFYKSELSSKVKYRNLKSNQDILLKVYLNYTALLKMKMLM